MEHSHSCASNTDEVFRTIIGCRVKGIVRKRGGENPSRIMVFECGWGLAFCPTGAFWIVSPDDVKRHVSEARERLEHNQRELQDVLTLAGG